MAYYTGDALAELKGIKATKNGNLDFATVPAFAKVRRKMTRQKHPQHPDWGTEEYIQEERDLGAMVSMLTVAVQQLTARIEELEK